MIKLVKKEKVLPIWYVGMAAILSGAIGFFAPAMAAQTEHVRPINKVRALPALILNDLDGKEHNLSEWRGKVIMLNFWATWCGPCQIEIPYFMKYQQAHAGQGLQIIGIGLDEIKNYATMPAPWESIIQSYAPTPPSNMSY